VLWEEIDSVTDANGFGVRDEDVITAIMIFSRTKIPTVDTSGSP